MRALTQLKLAGTKSFRLSASQLFDYGLNGQNTSKDILSMYEAPEGYSIVSVDQAGAEALIVAYLCRPGNYRELFIEGVKPHIYVALHIFLDKFQGTNSPARYWLKPPGELKKYDEWAGLSKTISSSKFEYDLGKKVGHACCDDKTEVLTPTGWVNIATKPHTILVCGNYGHSRFQQVIWNEYDFEGELHNFVGEEVDQCVTGNHKMLYITNGNPKTMSAVQLSTMGVGTRKIPNTTEKVEGLTMKSAMLKMAAAIQADGHFTGKRIAFHFKKLRKVEQLEALCYELGIHIEWSISKTDSYRTTILQESVAEALTLLTDYKTFNWNVLKLNKECIKILVNETVFWDGSTHESRTMFCSSMHINTDIINTAARLCGMGTTRTYSNQMSIVSYNERHTSYASEHKKVRYVGKVYCPTTSLGFFLIRRNGKISITGNSNYRMRANTFREQALKESNGTLNLSFEQADYFLETYKQIFPEIVEWQDEIEARVRETRLLRNLLGFPRRFEQIITDGYIREAISFIPQSTVGCITHTAYNLLTKFIRANKLRWRPFNNKHDSYAALVPNDEVADAARVMTKFMNQNLIGRDGVEFVMRSEVQVGRNMGKASAENPLGLKEFKL